MYQHRDWQGALLDFPANKVVCVGSNYAKHIKEMGSAHPEEPVIFIKPETALCDANQPIVIPKDLGSVHHEIELAVLIGMPLKNADEDRVSRSIAGFAVALDLTLRDLQAKFKKQGSHGKKVKRLMAHVLFQALFRLITLVIRKVPSFHWRSMGKFASQALLVI